MSCISANEETYVNLLETAWVNYDDFTLTEREIYFEWLIWISMMGNVRSMDWLQMSGLKWMCSAEIKQNWNNGPNGKYFLLICIKEDTAY